MALGMTAASYTSSFSIMGKINIIKTKSFATFCAECTTVLCTVIVIVSLIDKRRVFAYDESNNHTAKRWEYLYRYENKFPIDVMILGNSHAYTGLLPENMSQQLGKNCFILASQGNFLTDAYYMLKEALEITSPELLVIETYLIREYNQKTLKAGDLTCQIQSFEARRNKWQKFVSTMDLFSIENAPYAWSPTLRNHSYLFDNIDQLKYNLQHPDPPQYPKDIYLGRYVRFLSGIEQPVLERYQKEGAPVDGAEMTVSQDAFIAMDMISALCEEKGIKIMFLTLPMYKDHISNYSAWKMNLSELIEKYDYPWLDLQYNYNEDVFGPECFENTYKKNQHMTAIGARNASAILSEYILELLY